MSTPPNATGSCLCGAVRFEIAPPSVAFRYCHCSRCQKVTGAAHAANLFVPMGQFKWLAGESLAKRFNLPGASDSQSASAASAAPAYRTRSPAPRTC